MSDEPKGLYNKYRAIKVSTGEDVEGPWFLLRYDRDLNALVALRAYANAVRESNPELYADLDRQCYLAARKLAMAQDDQPGIVAALKAGARS